MEEIIKKLEPTEVRTLMELMKLSAMRGEGSGSGYPQSVKLDLPPVDLKLDGPATYLSWSRRVEAALVGRRLDGYLTGVKEEPRSDGAEADEWRTTHALLYTWLLNSMIPKVASSVDGIRKVEDIWAKLKRTYAGAENHMRVFQIQRDIEAVVQGDRSIQEYSMELEQLWQDLDHFSPMSSCSDPGCKSREFNAQMRTMQFLAHLNPAFDQRRSVILAQAKIPTLDEAVSAMIQEESRMRLHSESGGPPGARSALATLSSGMTGAQGETRKCYNCGEVGHLSKACHKPPREREAGGRGHPGGRGRGRGGRR